MWIVATAALTLVISTGPCDYLDKATVTGLLGGAPVATMPMGPTPDEDTDGTATYCTIRGPRSAVIVSQVAFKDADAARKATTKELVAGRLEDEVQELTEEKGLGDTAFWAYTAQGAQFVVLKGANVLAVSLGGGLPNPPKSYHDALRDAATSVAAKLP